MRFGGRRAQCRALTIVLVLATLAAWLAVEPAAGARASAGRRRVHLDALDRKVCGKRLADRTQNAPLSVFAHEAHPSWWLDEGDDGDDEARGRRRMKRRGRGGRRRADASNRLAAGWPVYPGEFPWWAGLLVNFGRTTRNCGSTIIHRNIVLTSAHCITHKTDLEPVEIIVYAGLFNLRQISTRQVVRARRWTRDNYFDKASLSEPLAVEFGHDMALIELEKELKYNEYVQPACLPANSSAPLQNKRGCVLASMGLTDSMDQPESLLALPMAPCRKGEFDTDGRRDETCYKTADAHKFPGRACAGDSGSGLVCPDDAELGDDARFYASGIASWGPRGGCERGRIELTIFSDLHKQYEHLLEMIYQMLSDGERRAAIARA